MTLLVNRSPVETRVHIAPGGENRLAVFDCGLGYHIDRVSPRALYEVVLAVTSPVVPVTTEGKEPDLRPFWRAIEPALAGAMRKAYARAGGATRKGDIKAAAYEVMQEAYLRASAGGTLPANVRQIFYVARPLVRGLLGAGGVLKDKYFTQHLLPDFIADNPRLVTDWDVIYDARGHIVEPHTGLSVPVGTAQVRDYLLPPRRGSPDLISVDDALWPTRGAENRFSTLLYIEKEGFEPLLRAARVPERFDCAVLSTKGTSVTAARLIVDRMAQRGVRVLAAHDFDRSGACIAHTLGNDTRRYGFEEDPGVVDLGLGLAEARAMGLEDEEAPDEGAGADKLREYGLGEDEIDFLVRQGRRVELNAMTSDQFVAWLEGKLSANGAGKVVPPAEVLDAHARRLLARRRAADRIAALVGELEAEAARATLPEGLRARVERELARDPALPWEDALARALEGA